MLEKVRFFSDFPLKSMNPVQSHSHPLANLVHQSGPVWPGEQKVQFCVELCSQKVTRHDHIVLELALDCASMSRKILEISKFRKFQLFFDTISQRLQYIMIYQESSGPDISRHIMIYQGIPGS